MINQLVSRRIGCLAALSALCLVACVPSSDSSSEGVPIDPYDMDAAAKSDVQAPADDATQIACDDPGCACDDDSEPKNCYPPPILSPTGTNLCAQGSMYCRDGAWSACQSLIQFGLDSTPATTTNTTQPSGLSGITSGLISTPTTCNPCHPNCFDALDRPVSTDLTASNASQVTVSGMTLPGVTYDPTQAGIRLTILSDSAQRGPATALAVCGNGVLESVEQCDDHNTTSGDGCDSTCLLEAGYYCPTEGAACAISVCGNGIKQGLEQCDDGNLQIGDGCTPQCALEPACVTGQPCTPVCGDGKVFPGEACDDGNAKAGDGCSPTCTLEPGWNCVTAASTPPPYLDLPIVYRDFVGLGNANPDAGSPRWPDGGVKFIHYDFEDYNPGQKNGMVMNVWDTDAGAPTYKKPVAVTPLTNNTIVSVAGFNQWYTDDPTVNITYSDTLRVLQQDAGAAGSYAFDTTAFFPLDGKAGTWTAQNKEKLSAGHNFSFTSEVRFWFVYAPPQTLDFRGDDDVWVFINGTLAVDIGGVHSAVQKSVTLNSSNASTYNLVAGKLYEAAVFQAERHTTGSNYRLTLAGFFSGKTTCTSICGDGIVTPNEYCDDGSANGSVGACLPDCQGRSPKYASTASYWRDYTATGTCHVPPERPLWGALTWVQVPSAGGTITFQLQGAETAAGVATAPIVSVPISTTLTTGSFDVHAALDAAGVTSDSPYLRVTALLAATPDQRQTPLLKQFDVSHTCVNVE